MMNKDCNSFIKVICETNLGHGSNFYVTVTDSDNKCMQSGCTNCQGRIEFQVKSNITYKVRVYQCGCFQPLCQSRWVTPLRECRKVLSFYFCEQRFARPLGKLNITLCDENYPEYKLSQGVFRLWRTF